MEVIDLEFFPIETWPAGKNQLITHGLLACLLACLTAEEAVFIGILPAKKKAETSDSAILGEAEDVVNE